MAVRFPHLKRSPLQIGYKLLHYRFINGVQGQGTESGKNVFGELAFHAQYGTRFPVRPSLVILAAPFDTLPEGDPQQLTTGADGKRPLSGIRISPDGRYVVHVLTGPEDGPHIWRVNVDDNNWKQLTNSPYDSPDLSDFSPDGKWVFYSRYGSEDVYGSEDSLGKGIWKVPIDGGEPIRLNEGGAGTPVVSADGKMIAYHYETSTEVGTAIMSIDGGPPLKRFDISTKPVRWTSDSRSLLYIKSGSDGANIWTQSLSGRAPKQITHFHDDQIANFDVSRDGNRLALDRTKVNSDVVLIRDLR